MDFNEQIKQLQLQLDQRLNHLGAQDPLCNRLMGRIETLREVNMEPAEVEQPSFGAEGA